MKQLYCRTGGVLWILFFLIPHLSAQTSSTYLYFKPIYAFPGASQTLEQNDRSVGNTTYSNGVYGSFATGLALQAGIGKMINTNFGVEMAAEWLNGKIINSSYNSDTGTLSVTGQATDRVKSFMLKPMLILRNSGDLLTFYSKLGLVIAVYSKGYSQGSVTSPDSNSASVLTQFSEEIKIKPKVGFAAAFGICARVSQRIAVTLEVNGQMLSLPETSGSLTQFDQNGLNTLPKLDPYQKTWNYKKSIVTTDDDLTPAEKAQPGSRLYSPLNFSYVGLSIGIRYYL